MGAAGVDSSSRAPRGQIYGACGCIMHAGVMQLHGKGMDAARHGADSPAARSSCSLLLDLAQHLLSSMRRRDLSPRIGLVPCVLGQGAAVPHCVWLGWEGAMPGAVLRVWVQSASVLSLPPSLLSLHLGACPSAALQTYSLSLSLSTSTQPAAS